MEDLIGKKLFVVVGTDVALPLPTLWLGTVRQSDYDDWFHGKSKLVMRDVRSMIIQPVDNTRVRMSMGPPYMGDTPGSCIVVDPISVEILGDIVADAGGTDTCANSGKLFRAYTEAVTAYRAALSGISIARGMQDIPQQGNVTQFPPRK